MTFELAKPGVVAGAISSGNISNANGNFTIKVVSAQVQFSIQVADITGGTDTKAKYEHSGMASGQFQLSGYALGDSVIGIDSLESFTENNGNLGSSQSTLTLTYGTGRTIAGNIVVSNIAVSFSRTSAYVGITISGRFSNTDIGNAAIEGG